MITGYFLEVMYKSNGKWVRVAEYKTYDEARDTVRALFKADDTITHSHIGAIHEP